MVWLMLFNAKSELRPCHHVASGMCHCMALSNAFCWCPVPMAARRLYESFVCVCVSVRLQGCFRVLQWFLL